MTQFNRQILPLYEWMNAAPEIDTLSLNELTLPGTHNAGCDLEAAYSNVFTRNWFACQDVSFTASSTAVLGRLMCAWFTTPCERA